MVFQVEDTSLFTMIMGKSLEGSYLYNKKCLFKMYYQSGINSFRGEYLNGSGVGMWSYFDNNGNLIKEIDCSIDDCE